MAGTSREQKGIAEIDVDPQADAEDLAPYVPKTPLGRRLMEIHEQIVASGQPMLESWEDLEREIAERRGGVYLDDAS